jgi:hypothetical protein
MEVVTALREIAAGKLVMVKRPTEKGKLTDDKEDMEVASAAPLLSEEEMKQVAEGPEADAREEQERVDFEDPITQRKVLAEMPEETLY